MRIECEGNLTADPEMRYLPDGTAVVNFSVAEDRLTGARDGEQTKKTSFYRFSAWRSLAENIALSLKKGDRVVVSGYADQRKWVDEASQLPRSSIEFVATSVGTSLRWAIAEPVKTAGRVPVAAGAPSPAEAPAERSGEEPF